MPFIIVTRHCHGGLTAITNCPNPNEPNPPIMGFDDKESAEEVADDNPLCGAFGYDIVRVNL